ncbi:MAG: nuclear transport factor 2 family protein [Pseudomonadota bacterium]
MTNIDVASAQLDAYNAQDLEKYVTYFTTDCVVSGLNGTPTETSRDAIKARYAKAFAQFPENKAELLSRIAVGNTVVDHELVIRSPGGEQFEIIAIYTFTGGLISRVDFAK